MNEEIRVFEGLKELRKGSDIILSNKIHLKDGQLGDMMRFIAEGNHIGVSGRTIYIYYRNDKPVASAYNFQYSNEAVPRFQVYVIAKYRRKGIGSQLFHFAKGHKKVSRFIVDAWDDRAAAFFGKVFTRNPLTAV